MSTEETNWIDQMRRIAEDFEGADVKSFRFARIKGRTTCAVAVLNADGELVTWELVDDGVSADRWRKLSSNEKAPLGTSTSGIIREPDQIGSCPDSKVLPAILEAVNPWSGSKRTEG